MLKVLKAGFYTTIQDRGRAGFASIGVPISGSMDWYSADLANGILNNSTEEAVLEITLGACQFQFLAATIICITGGDFSPTINSNPIQLQKSVFVEKGAMLSFRKVNYGVRCYLAIKGGIQSQKKLNSRSFYPNITNNFIIKKNDILSYMPFDYDVNDSKSIIKIEKNHFESAVIECYKGPEFDLLNQHQQNQILAQTFTISRENNRMGYKLNEEILNDLPQQLTSAVLPGTVQLTPSGKLIVLMRDCQVTGGYPRILQLTEVAINKLAQKTTDNSFRFSIISI
tara:strand:- start:21067 stop:21918 length:852 start_codon:yes stop_codon:yes gene_type:complete